MTYVGEIAHELPGRIRIKVSAARGDAAFFDRLAEDVASTPDIVAVRVNARAGSLTVYGDAGNGPVRTTLEQSGLFELRAPARVREREKPAIDPNTVLPVVLSGLGLTQLMRGRVTGPASENFWHAYRAQADFGNKAVAAAFTVMGLLQFARGRRLNTASSLFFYALTAQRLMRKRAPPSRRPER